MPSFRTAFVIAASILMVSAQTYSINPDSVPLATRQKWCSSQTATCPELCLQLNSTYTTDNTCNSNDLTYACVCGNGNSPNASQYSLTLPYFICTESDNQCVTACGSDNTCASACRQDNPCGAQDPVRVNLTSTTTSATASATSGGSDNPVYTGFGGSAASATASSKNAGKLALDAGASYGLAVVFAGVFAGFTLL